MARGKLILLLAVAAMFCFTETAANIDYGSLLVCRECDGCQQPVNYFLVAVYRILLVLNVGREVAVVYAPMFLHFFVFVAVRLCGVSGVIVKVIYRGMFFLIKRFSVDPVVGKYMKEQRRRFTDCMRPIGWKLDWKMQAKQNQN